MTAEQAYAAGAISSLVLFFLGFFFGRKTKKK